MPVVTRTITESFSSGSGPAAGSVRLTLLEPVDSTGGYVASGTSYTATLAVDGSLSVAVAVPDADGSAALYRVDLFIVGAATRRGEATSTSYVLIGRGPGAADLSSLPRATSARPTGAVQFVQTVAGRSGAVALSTSDIAGLIELIDQRIAAAGVSGPPSTAGTYSTTYSDTY